MEKRKAKVISDALDSVAVNKSDKRKMNQSICKYTKNDIVDAIRESGYYSDPENTYNLFYRIFKNDTDDWDLDYADRTPQAIRARMYDYFTGKLDRSEVMYRRLTASARKDLKKKRYDAKDVLNGIYDVGNATPSDYLSRKLEMVADYVEMNYPSANIFTTIASEDYGGLMIVNGPLMFNFSVMGYSTYIQVKRPNAGSQELIINEDKIKQRIDELMGNMNKSVRKGKTMNGRDKARANIVRKSRKSVKKGVLFDHDDGMWYTLNGSGINSWDELERTVGRYVRGNTEGLRAYYHDRPDDLRRVGSDTETMESRAISEILNDLSYWLGQGESVEYPEFDMEFHSMYDEDYEASTRKNMKKSRKPIRKEIHDIMDTDLVAIDVNTAMAYFSNGKETRGQTISIADGDSFEHLYSDFVDNGRSFNGWEDGIGNPVAWDIAEPIEPSTNGWRFVKGMRKSENTPEDADDQEDELDTQGKGHVPMPEDADDTEDDLDTQGKGHVPMPESAEQGLDTPMKTGKKSARKGTRKYVHKSADTQYMVSVYGEYDLESEDVFDDWSEVESFISDYQEYVNEGDYFDFAKVYEGHYNSGYNFVGRAVLIHRFNEDNDTYRDGFDKRLHLRVPVKKSARKGTRKGVRKGIRKDYAMSASEFWDDWADEDKERGQTYSSRKKHETAENIKDYEYLHSELMSIGHEIADYISIRYTTFSGLVEAMPVSPYFHEARVRVSMHPNPDTARDYDEVNRIAMKSIDIDIEEKPWGETTFKIMGVGSREELVYTDSVRDGDINSVYESIDRCMRKVCPEYFASTRKGMKKQSVATHGGQRYDGWQKYNQSPMMREAIDRHFTPEDEVVKSMNRRLEQIRTEKSNPSISKSVPGKVFNPRK